MLRMEELPLGRRANKNGLPSCMQSSALHKGPFVNPGISTQRKSSFLQTFHLPETGIWALEKMLLPTQVSRSTSQQGALSQASVCGLWAPFLPFGGLASPLPAIVGPTRHCEKLLESRQ